LEHPLNILLADDEEIIHQTIGEYLEELGHKVDGVRDGISALKAIELGNYDLALVDIRMPGMQGLSLLARIQEIQPDISVVIITAHGSMEIAVQALRLGAMDFLSKPIQLLELDAMLERIIQLNFLKQERNHLRDTIRGLQSSENLREHNRRFIGVSQATQDVRKKIQQAVEAECDNILITGETGTGKEVIAREIHFLASSDESPFIAVSCPALPESLIESELFGHEKGSFTGATSDRAGHFELAEGGTLFLDEVADLSPLAQAKLLRVLETRNLTRIGGSKEIKINVRVISATNSDLEELVKSGKFRQDLFYRLNVFRIHLFPLRDRQEDIIPLAEHFLSNYAAPRRLKFSGFSENAKMRLLSYGYPGNARELRNIVECAAILSRSGEIGGKHLTLINYPSSSFGQPETKKADEFHEREEILKALEEAKWNRKQAAAILGIPYSTLRYKIQKLRIGD